MDSIPKRRENGVPHFTEDNLQHIIINPFCAITVAPQLTQEHEPSMGEAEWLPCYVAWLHSTTLRPGRGEQTRKGRATSTPTTSSLLGTRVAIRRNIR
jgi:hypothetical protein